MKGKNPVRQRILDTATRLFYEQGYNSTGINQVIAESEVAKASFYDHFPTKEDLCVTYLHTDSEKWMLSVANKLEGKKTVEDKIITLFDHVGHFARENHYRGCAFLNVLSEVGTSSTKITEAIKMHKNKLLSLFQEMVGSPKRVQQLYLLYESALMESQVFAEDWPIKRAKEMALTILKN